MRQPPTLTLAEFLASPAAAALAEYVRCPETGWLHLLTTAPPALRGGEVELAFYIN